VIAFHPSLFPRDRVFARIDTLGAAPVVLVAGGAGSGKSTVVREYLAARKVPHVRLDGVAEHAVFEEFLRAFASAFAEAVPAMASSGGVTAAQLAQGGDDDAVLRWAREHLAGLETTVVLDDLHHALSNPRLVAFVRDLIDATVPRLRWILVTRTADALPVARWMATGLMELPLDEDDLRVSVDELRDAAATLGYALDDARVATLHAQTRGWPLGLAIALARGPDAEVDVSDREELYDAIVRDALAGLDAPAQDAVFATALAGRFDRALLAGLGIDPAEGPRMLLGTGLAYALDGDLFAYNEPYRERLLLRVHGLAPERRAALFVRAGEALAAAGRWTESIGLLLREGDPVRVADLLDRRGFATLDVGEATLVRDALETMPEELLAARPRLLGMKAALASLEERLDVSEAWFRMAIDAASGDTRREIVIRYGVDLVRRGRSDAVELLETEAAQMQGSSGWDAALWGLLGTAYVTAYRIDDARNAARRALQRIGDVTDPSVRARIFHQAAFVALNDRDFASAKDLAERAVAGAEESFLYDLAARALSVLYVMAIDVDDDAEAGRRALLRLEDAARKAGSATLRLYAILNSYELEVLAGNVAAIERLDAELRELHVFLTPLASETILPAQALRASWDGRFEHAYQLLAPGAEKQFDDDRRAHRWAEASVYAAAAGMRSESAAAMNASREALRKVDPKDRWALRTNAYLTIAVILLAHQGRARSMLADLRRSAREAGPRFGAMVDAIRALHARWTTGWHGDPRLSDALERLDAVELGGFARFLGALPLPTTDRARAGLLTEIEKHVLRLVAQGATSKEIAADLDRSSHTIDAHIRTICRKLGCSGRRQAVAFAIREGLITERRSR
jgi:DNA-binding NarL/FixJ family response regulator